MKKNFLAVALVLMGVLGLTGCSSKDVSKMSFEDQQDYYLEAVQDFQVFEDASYTVQDICERYFANDDWYVDLKRDPVTVQFGGNSKYNGVYYRSWIVFEVTESGDVTLEHYRYEQVDSLTAITDMSNETLYFYDDDALNAFYVVCEEVVG